MPSPDLNLADVPRALRADFGVAVSYAKLHALVVAGAVPAKHAHNKRWTICRADLKKVAAFIKQQEAEKQRAIEARRSSRSRQRVIDPLFAPRGTVIEYTE